MWYTERQSRCSISNLGARSVQICRKSQCVEPREAAESLTNDDYLVVTPQTEEFMEETRFRFEPWKRRAPIKISEPLYPTGEPILLEYADVLWDADPREYDWLPYVPNDAMDITVWFVFLIGITVIGSAVAAVANVGHCVRAQPKRTPLQSEQEALLRPGAPRTRSVYLDQARAMPTVYFPAAG